MALTTAQKTTLKADILAQPDALAIWEIGDTAALAALYNVSASPAWTVWKTSVKLEEIMTNGFDWVRVDNLSIGKARIWEWLFKNTTATINPSKLNVRAGIDETWKGTQADLDVRAAVYVHCKRLATRAERLFTTGTGSNADPGLLVFEGQVTPSDIASLVNL
jgi:hypothetical protein